VSASKPPRRNLLLASLAPSHLTELEQNLEHVQLAPGTLLQQSHQAVEFVYFPHGGVITLLASTSRGGAIETGMIGREGMIGASTSFGARPASTKAIVHVPGVADRIAYRAFQDTLGSNHRIRELVSRYTELLLATAQQVAACNALHEVVERLARVLLQALDRIDSELIPLTQQSLSEILGVRRTTINAAARALQASGSIRYSRGRIVLLDRAALEAAACECYAIVRPMVQPNAGELDQLGAPAAAPAA
jgi:CRP-like cAMP-binding protein